MRRSTGPFSLAFGSRHTLTVGALCLLGCAARFSGSDDSASVAASSTGGGTSDAGRGGSSPEPGKAGGASSVGNGGNGSQPGTLLGGASALGGSSACAPTQAAQATIAARIRRLTRLEMENTLSDLLGQGSAALAQDLEADTFAIGYSTGDERGVSGNYVDALNAVAEQAAQSFQGAPESQALVASCFASATSSASCARTFIQNFGARAYRRPLTQAELDGLFSVYTSGRATASGSTESAQLNAGLSYAVRALLQSASFIFRTELGDAASPSSEPVTLTPYETAAALSYALTASPPDAELTTQAKHGALSTPDELKTQGRRLLENYPERFARQSERFIREWLTIDVDSPAWKKDPTLYPGASEAFKAALDQETQLFLRQWASGASLSELLTTPRGFVSKDNAAVYDLTSTSAEFNAVTLDPQKRAGILTLPSFLGSRAHTDASSPVLRGVAILKELLCQEPPPVPAMVPPLPPADQSAVKTTRERYEQHTSVPFCASCHGAFEPMGFAFEHYDAVGHYRDQENGETVDSSGAIVGAASVNGPVSDAVQLSQRLATSPEVHACFVKQAYRFTLGRHETQAEACALDAYTQSFREQDLNVRELMLALVSSPSSLQRLPMSTNP